MIPTLPPSLAPHSSGSASPALSRNFAITSASSHDSQPHVPFGITSPTLYIPPMTKFTPIESEFPTPEEAEAHDAWVRAKVAKALASKKPAIPHDEVMAKARAIIAKHK